MNETTVQPAAPVDAVDDSPSPAWPPAPGRITRWTPQIAHVLAPNANAWTYEGTNTWVLSAGGRSLIVDPGDQDPEHLRLVAEAARADGARPLAIVLSHHHGDHRSGSAELASVLEVPVWAMADGNLAAGQTIDLGGTPITVIHTPGHSDDSICLWAPDLDVVLTGDTVLGGHSAGVMGGIGELLESLQKLHDLRPGGPILALPGHGGPFKDLPAVTALIADVRRRRIAQVRELVNAGVRELADISAAVYPSLTGEKADFGISTIVSTVEFLVEDQPPAGADPDGTSASIVDQQAREHLAQQTRSFRRMVERRSR